MSAESERRAAPRRECLLNVSYREVGDEGVYLVALVQDLTLHGASLILSRTIGAGTRLQIKVQLPGNDGYVRRELEVRHVTPYGDAAWIAGGPFETPLEPAEFEALG